MSDSEGERGLRRAERAIDEPAAIAAIIRAAQIAHVGFVEAGEPYVVPLNFGWEPGRGEQPDRFWFHSAPAGRKADLLAAGPRVCVQLEADLHLVEDERRACSWTQAYSSVMAWGRARCARDRAEARHGLDVLMRHHAGRDGWTYSGGMLDRTLVWCVDVDRVTAKAHQVKGDGA
jgi:uncharacterized protein